MGKRELPDTTVMEDTIIKSNVTPTLSFKDLDGTDDVINASISVDLTDTGSGTEDADIIFKQQVAGSLTEVLRLNADGPLQLGKDLEIKGTGTPGINFKDDDSTDDDVNVSITINATDTGSGSEDVDISIKQQIAGTLTEVVNIDADGDITFPNKNLIIKHATAPALYFKDDQATDDDINAQIDVNLTDTGTGAEDADVSFKAQIAGSLTEFLAFDASADSITLGNNGAILSDSFTATFTESVGALTVVVRQVGKTVTLEIPTGTTSDGGGNAIVSGATEVTAAYRPAANITFPAIVTENNALALGKVTVLSTGQILFHAAATTTGFTDNVTAGFERIAITYTLA